MENKTSRYNPIDMSKVNDSLLRMERNIERGLDDMEQRGRLAKTLSAWNHNIEASIGRIPPNTVSSSIG